MRRACCSISILMCGAWVQVACSSSDPAQPTFKGNAGSAGTQPGAAGATVAAGGSPVFVSSGGSNAGGSSGSIATAGAFFGGAGADSGNTGGISGGGMAGAATGGSANAGTGGAAMAACGVSTGSDMNIDDFEDGDTLVKLVDGRTGFWNTYNDGSVGGIYSSHAPTALLGHNASNGFCTDIKGFKSWGANIVANMSQPPCGYDASPYTGVCFWAKGMATGAGSAIFAVGTSDTVPVASGGTCLAACNAHYEHHVALTDTYTKFCYKWADFSAPTIAATATPKPTLDKSHIVQLEWKFPAKNMVSTDGSICIDDVTFE